MHIDPNTRVANEPTDVSYFKLFERVDNELLNTMHICLHVGGAVDSVLRRQIQNRINNELPWAVISDVTTTIDFHQFGANFVRLALQVFF